MARGGWGIPARAPPDGSVTRCISPLGQAVGPLGQAVGPLGQAVGPLGQAVGPLGQAVGPLGQAVVLLRPRAAPLAPAPPIVLCCASAVAAGRPGPKSSPNTQAGRLTAPE